MSQPSLPLRTEPSLTEEAVEALQQLLRTGDEADRCHASRALGELRARRAVPALIERLRDEDIDVCIDAAEALGKMGNGEAVGPLLETLENDPSGEVRTALIDAIGRLGGESVVDTLIRWAAGGPDEAVWDEDEEWDHSWDVQRTAVEALGRLRAPQAVPLLTEILTGADVEDIEEEVMRALARIGGEGEAVLIQQLESGTPRQRRRAVRALAICDTSSAWKAVLGCLRDPEPEVRVAAVGAFGSHTEISKFLRLLLALMHDKEPPVRTAVLALISTLRIPVDQSRAAVDRLIPMLEDASAAVRAAVIDALRMLMTDDVESRAPEQVRRCVEDENDQVVANACLFLGQYGDSADVPALFDVFEDSARDAAVRREAGLAIGALAASDGRTVEALTLALGDASQPVRLAALTALSQLHDRCAGGASAKRRPREDAHTDALQPAPLDVIIGVLKGDIGVTRSADEESPNVGAAVAAQETRDHKPASSAPSGADETPTAEAAAPEAVTEEDCAPSGGADGEDGTSQVHDEAENAPEGEDVSTGPTSTLDAIMRDNETVARAAAEPSLKPAPVDEELQEYTSLVQTNIERHERSKRRAKVSIADDVRRLSARILSGSGEQAAIQALIEAVNDADPEVRRDAANSLAVIAERCADRSLVVNAYGALVTHLFSDDYDVRLACARALGALRTGAALSPLLACLDDEEGGVRVQCIAALARLLNRQGRQDAIDHIDSAEHGRVIEKLRRCLSDPQAGVRKAAADALAHLNRAEAFGEILHAAFIEGGGLSRDIGRALRKFSDQQAIGKKLAGALGAARDSTHRRVVIEMMEEFFRDS